MPEATQLDPGPVEPVPPVPHPPRRRGGMFKDPVVARMGFLAIGLVILFLALVMGALVTGVTSPTGPRTVAEKDVAVAGAAVKAGSKDPAVWGEYISALISNGDYGVAQDTIAEARRTVSDSMTADIQLGEARLLAAQKKHEQAAAAADKAMKSLQAAFDAKVKGGGTPGKMAKAVGLPENYYAATLVKANAYRDMKAWDKAIAAYDVYIDHIVGASDILVDRGNAKAAAGDKAGAEKDFRKALEFVPDDKEALEGLKKIGVSK